MLVSSDKDSETAAMSNLERFIDQGTGFWHWAKLIGVVPLLTGLFSTCPLYSIIGMNTCPRKG